MAYEDKFVQVDGLKTRYIEDGAGPAAILLHGASLGSSADVFERNLKPLAAAGVRAIAYERAALLKEKYPQLNLHIVDRCKHLVQWDAVEQFHKLAGEFLPK